DDRAECAHEVDEAVLVGERVGREKLLRVLRAEAERARTVVDGKHADPGTAERTDRGEPVDPADVDHCRGNAHAAILPTARCVRSGHLPETCLVPRTQRLTL